MRVRAKRLGFYDLKRRREGEEFILHDPKQFSEVWMEAVDGKAPSKKKVKKAEAEAPAQDVSLDDDVI